MKSKTVWLLAGIIALTVPLFAQPVATDTLSALLVEVRQLRIVMERAATTTSQIQLLGTRLNIQNDRLARTESDYGGVMQELEGIAGTLAQLTAQIEEFENQRAQEPNPEQQSALAAEQATLKQQTAELTAREQRLRGREAELAASLAAEKSQWAELNRRLDDVERSIGVRPPP